MKRLYDNIIEHHLRSYRQMAFLRDRQPWFLVEAKKGREVLSLALGHFQKAIGAKHAFQIVFDEPFTDGNPFDETQPIVVSARTFLSQLV